MKKTAAVICSIFLLLSVSAAVLADDNVYTEGNLYYIIEEDSVTITGCFGTDEVIEIPAMIAGYPVNKIASGAFADKGIKEIRLPDTIMEIGENATGNAVVIFNANTSEPVTVNPSAGKDENDIENDDTNDSEDYSITDFDDDPDPQNDKTDGSQNGKNEDRDHNEPGPGDDADKKHGSDILWILPAVMIFAASAYVVIRRKIG